LCFEYFITNLLENAHENDLMFVQLAN